MEKRTYIEKEQSVADWYCDYMDHWHQTLGRVHNNKDFWEQIFYNRSTDNWWDLLDVVKVMRIKYPDEWRRYNTLDRDVEEIETRLMYSKPILKPYRKEYNISAYRFWQAFKDFLGDVTGTPTQRYTAKEQLQADEALNVKPFDTLFERKDHG